MENNQFDMFGMFDTEIKEVKKETKKEETKKNVKDRLVSLVTKKEPEDLLNKQLNKSSAIIRKIDKLVDEKIDDDFDFTDLDPEDDDMSDVIYDELVKDDKNQYSLVILDPTNFWSVSKYLVLLVK